jgi:hypothetical protein
MFTAWTFEMMTASIRERAAYLRGEVARGARTPQFAAVLLREWGAGFLAAHECIAGDDVAIARSDRQGLRGVLDEQTDALDPRWREYAH